MLAQRRSSSPLSSASPSPLQPPTESTVPLTALNLPPAAADEDGIVGGSSPTTLTEPLTESELTEDEEEMDEHNPVPEDDALDALSDIGDDDEADGNLQALADRRRSPDGSSLSPSPSLTPPPPSDPPHPQALPSSPHAQADGNDDTPVVKLDDDDEDDALLADDEAVEEHGAHKADLDPDSGDEELTPEAEEGDGDITMRAEDAAEVAAAGNGDATDAQDSPVKHEAGDDGDVELEEEPAEAEAQAEEPQEEAEEEAEADAEEEADETDAPDTGAVQSRTGHSSHAPLPTPAAIRALFALEVKFAALRDRLYVERLEEAAREEEMILNGTHPALIHLNKTLQTRRERLHEVASRRHQATINDLGTWRKIEDKISWSTWTDQRDQLHWDEFESTWSKRRRLAREKNELETPKVYRPVPRVDRPPKPFDWSAGAVPPKLSTEDALQDLKLMDARRQQQQQQQAASRHASPMYGSYAQSSSSLYPYQAAQHPANYLQSDQAHPERRHQDPMSVQRPAQQQQRPTASQHTQSHAHVPEVSRMPVTSSIGPSRPPPQAPPRKVDPYPIPPRRDAASNGGGVNGHARQPPRPLASANSPASQSEAKPAAGPASRYPGFTEYLSGSHMNKPAQSTAPAPGAALVRPAFSPQVPAGSAQRS